MDGWIDTDRQIGRQTDRGDTNYQSGHYKPAVSNNDTECENKKYNGKSNRKL